MICGSMPEFHDHFSSLASDYSSFRPTYPPELVAAIAATAPGRALAWDCATGNGQAALLLADHFEAVVATDASEAQLKLAKPHPRVEYRVALAERSGLADGSVDLVAIAQAFHWFDVARSCAEFQRVLKPRGVVAAWCYQLAKVDDVIDPVVWAFYDGRVGRFWPPERRHIEVNFRDLDFPFDEEGELAELGARPWSIDATLTRERFLGYVATWSAVKEARKQQGVDPMPEFVRALAKVWPEGETRAVRWPMGLRIGRRST
jgi:ubiquinone/menaquinone biosynthesis C-methylase UbiE